MVAAFVVTLCHFTVKLLFFHIKVSSDLAGEWGKNNTRVNEWKCWNECKHVMITLHVLFSENYWIQDQMN